jgi:hypothetical protein
LLELRHKLFEEHSGGDTINFVILLCMTFWVLVKVEEGMREGRKGADWIGLES